MPASATLSFWYLPAPPTASSFDWQDAYITDSSGTILQTIFHQCTDNDAWVNQTVDMSTYAGQTVRIKFLVHGDAFGDLTAMYVDDVRLIWAVRNTVTRPDTYCDSNRHGHCHTYSYSYSNGHGHTYAYFHAQGDANAEIGANATGSSHSAAEAVSPGSDVRSEK